MDGCDTLLIVGTNDPWTEFLPAPGQARAVQVDIDGRHMGMRYPIEVELVGDAGRPCASSCRCSPRQAAAVGDWRGRIEAWVVDWWNGSQQRALEPGVPLNPQRVLHELSAHLPADALVAVDVGSVTYWYGRYLRLAGRYRPTCPARWRRWARRCRTASRRGCPPRPAGRRAGRGRRDADERPRRADHGR